MITTQIRSEEDKAAQARLIGRPGITLALAAIGLLTCFLGIWLSARAGFSREISDDAGRATPLATVNEAVRMTPADPKGYLARARLLSYKGELAAAEKSFAAAVALQPDDHLLWLRLGYARENLNDQAGALAAYQQAARLAPFYGQPHWYVGNTLLRLGRADEAFTEIRRAAISNPQLLPKAIDLAWAAASRAPSVVVGWLQPQTPSDHLALASFFAANAQPSYAIGEWHAAGQVPAKDASPLVTQLLSSKSYSEAFEVWATSQPVGNGNFPNAAGIVNGRFEEPITLDDPGFGWRLPANTSTLHVSLDREDPRNGMFSLRVDWNGESDPSIPLISQLALVQPNTRYRLSFAARTQELLTVGLPLVSVVDAADEKTLLGQSASLPKETSGWQVLGAEFTTPATTRAVLVSVRRQCATHPCAAFGHAWFDDFTLEHL